MKRDDRSCASKIKQSVPINSVHVATRSASFSRQKGAQSRATEPLETFLPIRKHSMILPPSLGNERETFEFAIILFKRTHRNTTSSFDTKHQDFTHLAYTTSIMTYWCKNERILKLIDEFENDPNREQFDPDFEADIIAFWKSETKVPRYKYRKSFLFRVEMDVAWQRKMNDPDAPRSFRRTYRRYLVIGRMICWWRFRRGPMKHASVYGEFITKVDMERGLVKPYAAYAKKKTKTTETSEAIELVKALTVLFRELKSD